MLEALGVKVGVLETVDEAASKDALKGLKNGQAYDLLAKPRVTFQEELRSEYNM